MDEGDLPGGQLIPDSELPNSAPCASGSMLHAHIYRVEQMRCRYDLFGSNFQVPLRLALTSMSMDEADLPGGQLIPDSELPELPGELCGIWAYIQWEAAGCPNRSQAESDGEYQKAIAVRQLPTHLTGLQDLGLFF